MRLRHNRTCRSHSYRSASQLLRHVFCAMTLRLTVPAKRIFGLNPVECLRLR